MGDRRYPRPRSPVSHIGRQSLPVGINYAGYTTDLHAVPTRREVYTNPRSSSDRIGPSSPTITTYKITPEVVAPRSSSIRAGSRTRRSTLDNASKPTIINAGGSRRDLTSSGRPASPIHNVYRSSDEGDYYTMPASSDRKHRHRSRPSYSATIDNSEMNRLGRETGQDRMLRVGSGRDGALYPGGSRSRPMYSGSLVRHPDTVADDYGDDGYGYTNPRDLVQYDLNRTNPRYARERRESFDGQRSGRPSSISSYGDVAPRPYDTRDRGPPPTTRGLDKVNGRAAMYDAAPVRMPIPPIDPLSRIPRAEPYEERKSRRPVSLYHQQEPERRHRDRDDYYDPRDDDLRRDKQYRGEKYDDDKVEQRGFGVRTEREKDDYKKEEYKKSDYDKKNEYDRRDYDKRDDKDDHKERKGGRDTLAAGLSIAGAALGISGLNKATKEDDRDERDDREPRRRRDERRHESRDEREPMDLPGRDQKERHSTKDERNPPSYESREPRERISNEEKPEAIDLSGRNPQEKRISIESREDIADPSERRGHRIETAFDGTPPDSRGDSPASDQAGGVRSRRVARDGPTVPFNPKDTMDLRALKEALNRQDAPALSSAPALVPVLAASSAKEQVMEPAFDARDPRDIRTIQAELREREDRNRRDVGLVNDPVDRRPAPRVVSPPREEIKKVEEKPAVKSILRIPREKFPEDPAPIREGVAPLKDAKKDGVPPDARWTKISRKLVNPEALEAGKERYEAREDFVIVLRVLSREEIQGYAEVTQKIRANREEEEEREHRHRRRERHERHKREGRSHRSRRYHDPSEDHDQEPRRHRRDRQQRSSESESDTTDDEATEPQAQVHSTAPKSRRITFDDNNMQGSQGSQGSTQSMPVDGNSNLREDPEKPGTYSGYTRNPPRKEH